MYGQEKNFGELALLLHLFRGRSCVVLVLGTREYLSSKLPESRFQACELLAGSSALPHLAIGVLGFQTSYHLCLFVLFLTLALGL